MSEKLGSMRVIQEGPLVHIIFNGKKVATFPWEKAQDCANAIMQVAKMAEEWEHAQAIKLSSSGVGQGSSSVSRITPRFNESR
jgi:hypothetical protein